MKKAFILFIFFIVVVLPLTNNYLDHKPTPDTLLSYNDETILKIGEELGQEGRLKYVYSRIFMDILWPLVYTYFFYQSLRSRWVIMPLILDYIENINASIQMISYPAIHSPLNLVGSLATSLKWFTLTIILGWSLLALSKYLIGLVKSKEAL